MSNCPTGKIRRKSYNRRSTSGSTVHVPANCIVDTSGRGHKRSDDDKKIIKARERIQNRVNRKYGVPKCPNGQVARSGYIKKSYSRKNSRGSYTKIDSIEVKPACVSDQGASGKHNKLPIVLEKGDLKKYGYENVSDKSSSSRHRALSRAVKDIKPLSLFRKLIILSTMNKTKNPILAKKFKSDAKWIKSEFGLLRTLSRSKSRNSKSRRSRK